VVGTRRSFAVTLGGVAFAAVVAAPEIARAQGIEGPALIGWYPKFNQDFPDLSVHGPGCLNVPENMPADRREPCGYPTLTSPGPGQYTITGDNLAPFPVTPEDSGWALFVTTIGGNAHCFETGTTISGVALTSEVRCVDPASGEDIESDFAWSYRADSLEHPQTENYAPSFAYARALKDGTLVPEESLNPLDLRDDDVLVERNGPGSYTVVFRDLNPLEGSLLPALSPYNVLVQKTCSDDTNGGAEQAGCYRAVCNPESWTPGDFTTYDTSVEVRCFSADGAPRDTGFRVWFGDDGFTSQRGWNGPMRFAWTNLTSDVAADACRSSPELPGTSQHETPETHYPGLPVEACRAGPGAYDVNFVEQITPYSIDAIAPVVSSLAPDGTYCNVGRVDCGLHQQTCARPDAPENARVTVACFDSSGNPADSPWTMNMTY
jgi:hypothetical protein